MAMRKRERENPCFLCNHYHKYEEGEPCGVCGHRMMADTEKGPQESAFSTEILPNFLYLGSYDNASRSELLKAQGIGRILNTVPGCQNLYKNSFVYHCITSDGDIPFDECVAFIEETRQKEERVLVHCMSGQNRSPAVVMAYLMRHKGWRLPECYQWVKDRRPSVNISPAMARQLQDYEERALPSAARTPAFPSSDGGVVFGLGYTAPAAPLQPPPAFGVPPVGAFGAQQGPAGAAQPPTPPFFPFSQQQGPKACALPNGTFVFGARPGGADS